MRRVRESEYSIVLLDWTIPMISRFRLAAAAKARRHATAVVVLHASGALNNPHVDAAVDTRAGVEQILTALNEAQRQLSLRAHEHTELDSEYVVVANRDRRYTYVSLPVCELLGYSHSELLEMTIDQLTYPESADSSVLFHQFLADGSMTGEYILQDRLKRPVKIHYHASVLEDGCLISEWKVLSRPEERSANPGRRKPETNGHLEDRAVS